MIKRRFYRFTHGDKDAPSESSSSSDSEVEAEAIDETESEEEEEDKEENVVLTKRHKQEASSSSGYESEDSSENEINLDSSDLPASDDDAVAHESGENIAESFAASEGKAVFGSADCSHEEDETPFDVKDCVLKHKSVFKCRLCPRIVCLSEETLKAHLNSKKHARSEKLYGEGRLKLMLNSEGKIEGETHLDDHDVTTVSPLSTTQSKKKSKGRWKQRKRLKQEMRPREAGQSNEKQRKRRKNE